MLGRSFVRLLRLFSPSSAVAGGCHTAKLNEARNALDNGARTRQPNRTKRGFAKPRSSPLSSLWAADVMPRPLRGMTPLAVLLNIVSSLLQR
jgi:hypothetical protein